MNDKEVTILRPDDWHLHLRQGFMLKTVLPHTVAHFNRALIMPNTSQGIRTADDVVQYQAEIVASLEPRSNFTPLMTVKITEQTKPDDVLAAYEAGTIAGKVYPQGLTTNADDGVLNYEQPYPVFAAMEKTGMVLCLHGEQPGDTIYELDRELRFLVTLKKIVEAFPNLRVVLEHITTRAAVKTIKQLPNTVAATITVHHLLLTTNDVLSGKLKPHNFCKPVAKRFGDRRALIKAATSGNPKFFFGSDSAPHRRQDKVSDEGCAGIFTSPVALALLAQLFDSCGLLHRLEGFVSRFGAGFYRLPPNEGTLRVVQRNWQVSDLIGEVRPFYVGQQLAWQVIE